MNDLIHEFPLPLGARAPAAEALVHGARRLELRCPGTRRARRRRRRCWRPGSGAASASRSISKSASRPWSRMFGAAAAGGVFVPVNPLLKAEQVAYILRDCDVRVLVTSARAAASCSRRCWPTARTCARSIVDRRAADTAALPGAGRCIAGTTALAARRGAQPPPRHRHRHGGDPLHLGQHRQAEGRGAVAPQHGGGREERRQYLENRADDRMLAALPLSFDAGFSQLTTAFHAGARVVLLNYLLPRDVLDAVARERITGLTAVPPLWIQLAQLEVAGRRARSTCATSPTPAAACRARRSTRCARRCRRRKPFLMYGLTEAFRSTYLPPDEVDRRPDSIGKAIPNAEILVLREDGTPCAPDEPGELVHRGALVALGYWNDPEKTAERFKPLPGQRRGGLMLPEIAVFSGDTVRTDDEGFLYFIGRRDEMIKTSGYRVSPTEVEEVALRDRAGRRSAPRSASPHPTLGQAIVVVATPRDGGDARRRRAARRVPAAPAGLHGAGAASTSRDGPLPRNPNGKIDRKLLGAASCQDAVRSAKP